MKGILKRRIFRETLEHTPFGSFKERNHETIHSRNRYRNLKGMPTSTTEQGTGFRSSHGCCTRLLNSSDKGRSARRSPASSFPRGSIYATIMELGPKRPSPWWFFGPNSIIVVCMDPLGSGIQDLPGFTGQNRKSDSLGFRGSCGSRNKKAPQSKQCILVYNRKGYDTQTIGTLALNPKPQTLPAPRIW